MFVLKVKGDIVPSKRRFYHLKNNDFHKLISQRLL